MKQTKEKQSNQLPLPQEGDHNARQVPLNTTIRQQTGQNMNEESPEVSSHSGTPEPPH